MGFYIFENNWVKCVILIDIEYVWGVMDDVYVWGVVLVKWVEEGRKPYEY